MSNHQKFFSIVVLCFLIDVALVSCTKPHERKTKQATSNATAEEIDAWGKRDEIRTIHYRKHYVTCWYASDGAGTITAMSCLPDGQIREREK